MPNLLVAGPAPLFVAGDPAAKAAARTENLTYPGGAISGPLGTLDYFFDVSAGNSDFCNSPAIQFSRGGHSRRRVIGGTSTTVKAANITLKQFPFVDDQTGQAGVPVAIIDVQTGEEWTVRRRGSMQSMIEAICGGYLQAARNFYIQSSRGRTYGPFIPPAAAQP